VGWPRFDQRPTVDAFVGDGARRDSVLSRSGRP
jgi:hypothetical protein